MKEDVLEQIVDDYLKFSGYFTAHNVGFKPSKDRPDYVSQQDSVASDIDVIAFHPKRSGLDRVVVVSCKSWQSGFDADLNLARLRGEKPDTKRASWKRFRELWVPKWSDAFLTTVEDLTGVRQFSYRIAVTRLEDPAKPWGDDPTIAANLPGCEVGFLTLAEMWTAMLSELTTRPAASEMGRLVQLLKAAGLTAPPGQVTKPSSPDEELDAEDAADNEDELPQA
jgi:hypothetical protein